MTTLRNGTAETIYFRDDAGKHKLAPGSTLELVGEQHTRAALEAGLTVEGEIEIPEPTRIRSGSTGRIHGAAAKPVDDGNDASS
jgi:hypothetical protein